MPSMSSKTLLPSRFTSPNFIPFSFCVANRAPQLFKPNHIGSHLRTMFYSDIFTLPAPFRASYSPPKKTTNIFSTLPAEIHVCIAEQCEIDSLFNLCLTSKSINERCTSVLYRRVDLDRDRHTHGLHFTLNRDYYRQIDAFQRQRQLVQTLLSRPEYGKHIRVFKGTLSEGAWGQDQSFENSCRALESLTHVQSVEVGSKHNDEYQLSHPPRPITCNLFQSATSVTLVGHLDYNLAKSILNSINPATLKHLCLNTVQELNIERFLPGLSIGDISEDGRLIAYGATSGLLVTLTGRCTAIQTLILRRRGQIEAGYQWHDAAEDASYTEWASFLGSVQSTVEEFTFEQAGRWTRGAEDNDVHSSSRTMDDRFRRLILPTIVSGNWPCLKRIELQGVRSQDGEAGLTTKLRVVLGGDTKIVIKEQPLYVEDLWRVEEQYDRLMTVVSVGVL